MKLATFIDHRRRVRAAVQHLAARLQAHPHEWPSLRALAEVAHLSPYHFLRVYQHAVGETPQVTVRRLKLEAASVQLQGGSASVLDVALDHGYDSAQAFARAYGAYFGQAPSRHRQQHLSAAEPGVRTWLAELPAMPMQAMPIPPGTADVGLVFDEFMGHLDKAEVPRHGQDVFCVMSPEGRLTHAGALQNPWVDGALRLERHTHGGARHLCLVGQPDAVWRQWRLLAPAASRHPGRALLLRYLNDPAYKARSEQRIELYVPMAARAPGHEG